MWMSKFAALLLLTVGGPAIAAEALISDGAARVAEIVDGDTLVLDDGLQARLVGIQAPKLPLGRPHVKRQPLAEQAENCPRRINPGAHGPSLLWRTAHGSIRPAACPPPRRRWALDSGRPPYPGIGACL